MLSDVLWRPMWDRWRHTWPSQNRYMWYIFSVFMHHINFEQAFTLEAKKNSLNELGFRYGWLNTALGAVVYRPSAIHTQNVCDHFWNVWLYSWSVKTMVTSGRPYWDNERKRNFRHRSRWPGGDRYQYFSKHHSPWHRIWKHLEKMHGTLVSERWALFAAFCLNLIKITTYWKIHWSKPEQIMSNYEIRGWHEYIYIYISSNFCRMSHTMKYIV